MDAGSVRRERERLLHAVHGRPLATFCSSYLAGASLGLTVSLPWVLHLGGLWTVAGWTCWRLRLCTLGIALLSVAGMWLGVASGVAHTRRDELLWQSLPRDEAAVVWGEVVTEPVKRRDVWRFLLRARRLHTPQGEWNLVTYVWVEVPADRLTTVLAGEVLELEGRLREPRARDAWQASWVEYLRRRGVTRILRPYRVVRVWQAGWRVVFSRWRQQMVLHLRRHLPAREGDIAAAIVLNERSRLDPQIRESFRRTGTVHILSPSGTHVSMIALAVWSVCRVLGLRRQLAALSVIAVIWLFAGIAAGGEPAFRAAVMGTSVAAAVALQREVDLPTSLALAGFLIVMSDTGALLDPGFQFSFTLVAALLAASPWLGTVAQYGADAKARPVRMALAILLASGVCAVASAPLTALYYGQVSCIAPLANLLIALPVQIVTSAGLLLSCLPSVPELLATPVAFSTWLVDRTVRWLASPAWASIAVSAPTPPGLVIFYLVFFGGLFALSARAAQRRRQEIWGDTASPS